MAISGVHDVLVWSAVEGERTSQGHVLPAGWVWTCSCGESDTGFCSEMAAEDDAEGHESDAWYAVSRQPGEPDVDEVTELEKIKLIRLRPPDFVTGPPPVDLGPDGNVARQVRRWADRTNPDPEMLARVRRFLGVSED